MDSYTGKSVYVLREKTERIITIEENAVSASPFNIIHTFKKSLDGQANVNGEIAPRILLGHIDKGYLSFEVQMTNRNKSATDTYIKLYISNDNKLDNHDRILSSIYTKIPSETNRYPYKAWIPYDLSLLGGKNVLIEISTQPHKNEDSSAPLVVRIGSNIARLGAYYFYSNTNIKSSMKSFDSEPFLLNENENSEPSCQLINFKSEIKINVPSEYLGTMLTISGLNGGMMKQFVIQDTEMVISNEWKYIDNFILVRFANKNNVMTYKFSNQ